MPPEWCSLVNVNRAARAQILLKEARSYCHAHGVCFRHFGQKHAQKLGSRALAVLLFFLLTKRSRYRSYCRVEALLWPCPVVLMYHPPSSYLHTLDTVLENINNFVMPHMDVLYVGDLN